MPQVINISDAEIQYAESILLPEGKHFNDERKEFIRNFATIDLQAVPGSGKTTALLAKLLILEKKMPFEDGSGILVLSHTNAAIDEIKEKLSSCCPKLFSYPNFIGTIQSFVDEFLAIPYFVQRFKKKPIRIDNEIFEEIADSYYRNMPNRSPAKIWIQRQREPESIMKYLFMDMEGNLKKGINGPQIFAHTSTAPTYTQLKNIKIKILKSGFLNYDDAYFLAEVYIHEFPKIISILQRRFAFVFVDEMQDMDIHQYNLLEKIFFIENSTSVIQRIGDKNQSIYNAANFVKAADIWQERPQVLRLSDSLRLSASISNVVSNLALYRGEGFTVNGINECTLKPHILVYTNDNLKEVIPFFARLVNGFRDLGLLPNYGKYPIKAIAWSTEWKTQEEIDDVNKIRLVDYYNKYSKIKVKAKNDYTNLKSYLLYYDKNKSTLESVRKSILNSILKILRIEKIVYEDDKYFTKKKLLDFIKEINPEEYENLKLNIYNWSIGLIRGDLEGVLAEIRTYIPTLCGLLSPNPLNGSLDFINNDTVATEVVEQESAETRPNIHSFNDVTVEITSVHSVKGQTHCATLYLETFFDRGYGNYESERLRNQFTSSQTVDETIASITTSHDKVKQSAKMAFVGFSRPTDLLCVAIHKDRFDAHLSTISVNDWEVIEVTPLVVS
jgi:DNA helicase-2/ATP-dependent DNA helicase PcrA